MSHSIIGLVAGGGGDDGGAKEQNDSDCYDGWLDQHSNVAMYDRAKHTTSSSAWPCLASPQSFEDDLILDRGQRTLETAGVCPR